MAIQVSSPAHNILLLSHTSLLSFLPLIFYTHTTTTMLESITGALKKDNPSFVLNGVHDVEMKEVRPALRSAAFSLEWDGELMLPGVLGLKPLATLLPCCRPAILCAWPTSLDPASLPWPAPPAPPGTHPRTRPKRRPHRGQSDRHLRVGHPLCVTVPASSCRPPGRVGRERALTGCVLLGGQTTTTARSATLWCASRCASVTNRRARSSRVGQGRC